MGSNILKASIAVAVSAWLVAKARNNRESEGRAKRQFAALMAGGMAYASLLGHTETLAEAWRSDPIGVEDAIQARIHRIAAPSPTEVVQGWPSYTPVAGKRVPPVFREALRDLQKRVPVAIQPEWLRSAQAIGELYVSTGQRVIAATHAADLTVTKKVQKILSRQIEEGLSLDKAVRGVRKASGDWTTAYAENVVRTNLTGVQAQGRLAQAKTPVGRAVIAGMQFVTMMDPPRVRPNHLAAHGTVMTQDDPRWQGLIPPLGYNCRCRIMPVTWAQATRMGLVDAAGTLIPRLPKPGAGPDRGFAHMGQMTVGVA